MNGVIRALIFISAVAIGTVAACKPSADSVKQDLEQTMTIHEYTTMRCPECTEWKKLGMAKDFLDDVFAFIPAVVPLVDYSGNLYSPSYPERYAGQSTDLEIPDLPDGYPFEMFDPADLE